MTLHTFWNESWTAALVNHLWQSTLFVVIAWLLAWMLRDNQARTRYWIWMIASIKFLIPFSILITAGEFLRTSFATQIQSATLAAVMEQIAQPFPQAPPAAATTIFYDRSSIVAASPDSLFSLLLPLVWLCGFLIIVISWVRSWIRIRRAVHASPQVGLAGKTPILLSRHLLEPAAFGVFRPVLLLPEVLLSPLITPARRTRPR